MTVPAAHLELFCDFSENKAQQLSEDLTDGIAPIFIILMATKETAGARGMVALRRTPIGKGKGKDKSLDNDVGPPVPNPEFQTG
jgi:hypothetical protein